MIIINEFDDLPKREAELKREKMVRKETLKYYIYIALININIPKSKKEGGEERVGY